MFWYKKKVMVSFIEFATQAGDRIARLQRGATKR